jgi:hypothetical protein
VSDDLRSNFLSRTVEWLRAGYPSGVPRQDYVVLLGLLQRKLTEEEPRTIAQDLTDESVFNGGEPVTADDIET